jgi:Rrf2 family protein
MHYPLMQHFSKTAGYAVYTLSFLGAAAPEACLVRDIAGCLGLPKPYLAKIVNQLVHAGLVRAKRGHRGGVMLMRPPERISLLEVVRAIDGGTSVSPCLFGLETCPVGGTCPAHAQWNAMRKQMETTLSRTPLSAMMKSNPVRRDALLRQRERFKAARASARSAPWFAVEAAGHESHRSPRRNERRIG